MAVERVLHERYLAEFGIDPASLAGSEQSPDCLAYTSFLLATAHQEPWEVLLAALLPCFQVYWEVGCRIAGEAARENPYRAWIDTYADPQRFFSYRRKTHQNEPDYGRLVSAIALV